MITNKLKNQRGQAMIDIAFTLLAFMAYFAVMVDVIKIAYTWTALQYSVNYGARYSSTGAQQLGSMGTPYSRIQSVENTIRNTATALMVNLNSPGGVQIKPSATTTWAGNTGSARQIMTIQANAKVDLSSLSALIGVLVMDTKDKDGKLIKSPWKGIVDISASTIIQNEPF